MPTPFGFVRLGHDQRHLMAVSYQPLQARDGESRCTHKDDAHRYSPPIRSPQPGIVYAEKMSQS